MKVEVEITEDEAIHILETQKLFCETYDGECPCCKSIKSKLFSSFTIPEYLKEEHTTDLPDNKKDDNKV